MSRFQKATRKQLKLRLALVGPTGSGKTKTALLLAAVFGKRIAVVDTENRSASKYVGEPGIPEFDVLELDSYAPQNYVDAIKEAEREGYEVIIVDGVTQAWSGKDGALEMVDKAAKRSQSGNSFTAWRDVTPHHNNLVEALVQCKAHLITTMRAKMEYVLDEDSRGKKTPRKIGMAPVQREGLEYEFDVVGDMDVQHNLLISKTRCSALDQAVIHLPGRELAETLLAWLSEGAAPAARGPNGEKVDEYGLLEPREACPVVTRDGPNKGLAWKDLKGPLVEKMFAESGDKMSPNGRAWCEYIIARRAKRKAAEALAAEQEAAERALASQEPPRPFAAGEAGPVNSSPTSSASSRSTTESGPMSTTNTDSTEDGETAPESEGGCGADAAELEVAQ